MTLKTLALVALTALGLNGASSAAAQGVDPKAAETLKKMATLLASARTFSVEAEESFDAEFARAYRTQLTNVRSITVERPSHFAAVATGDSLHRNSWFDGKTLTVFNTQSNAYVQLEAPGTIDAVLDKVAADYDIQVPLSDLLYADPYATLMDGVIYGKYLGIHHAGGVACHHLTFGQDGVQWQIWIDAGAQPLPRKLAIAYWDQPGVPQYQATFKRFELGTKVAPAMFAAQLPAGAKKLDLSGLKQ